MDYKITLICKDDYRSFPKGYKVVLNYTKTNTLFLMGNNGCGKSTIVQAIRGTMNSNGDAKAKWNAVQECNINASAFDVTIDGFEHIYHCDADGLDNTTSMFNAASATDFVDFGGWATRNMSAGEKSLIAISKLKKEVVDDENTLIILDELDNHLDYDFRVKFIRWFDKMFPKSKKLVITHDLLMTAISDGDIVQILSERSKETNLKCRTMGKEPMVWSNKTKDIFFHIITNYKLAKSENNDKKEENGE